MMMTLSMSMKPGLILLPLMMLMMPAAMMMKEAEVFVLAASPKT